MRSLPCPVCLSIIAAPDPSLTGNVRRGNEHGPPFVNTLSTYLTGNITTWQATLVTLLCLYFCGNLTSLIGLDDHPNPLNSQYSPSFFRATWITTALDAGFWTAMRIKPYWLRDIASVAFSVYYLFAADQADEKVRRVRATLTLEHIRVSWSKATTPCLSAIARMVRPRLMGYPPRVVRIARPAQSWYVEPVSAWLYFDGPLDALAEQTCVVLDFPGGGFVALSPRNHDDRLLAWAGSLKIPIVSLEYKKAPEYPYPYALHEGFDVYRSIVASNGRCLGLSGRRCPRIVVTGDSAGGNLAAGTTLMVLGSQGVPRPEGVFLAYPCLNVNVESWMSEEKVSLIGGGSLKGKKLEKVAHYYNRTLLPSPSPSADSDSDDDDDLEYNSRYSSSSSSHLAASSIVTHLHDRILTPEHMRALIVLYIDPCHLPDLSTDYLLSPVLAPESLLAEFPRTCFLTGACDPLVDDTVFFAGRLQRAKTRLQRGLGSPKRHQGTSDGREQVEVSLIPGVSHGFFQMVGFFPEGWGWVGWSARRIGGLFGRECVDGNKLGPTLESLNEGLLSRRVESLVEGLMHTHS